MRDSVKLKEFCWAILAHRTLQTDGYREAKIAWQSGTVPLEWQTGVKLPLCYTGSVPLYQKVAWKLCSKDRGNHTPRPPGQGLPKGTVEENSANS